jgi:aspartate racemase
MGGLVFWCNSLSRADYVDVMCDLVLRGAECVIPECTEIRLLVQSDTTVPAFNTMAGHAVEALEAAVSAEMKERGA